MRKHITSDNKEKLFVLVATNVLGRQIVPEIHSLEQLQAIYIYCFTTDDNKVKWAKTYCKIKYMWTTTAQFLNYEENEIENANATSTALFPYELVWLDDNDNDQLAQLLRTIEPNVKAFKSVEQCEQHIETSIHDKPFILVASNALGRQIVPEIHVNNLLINIYIYCFTDQDNKIKWAKPYTKIQNVSVNMSELLSLLKNDSAKHRNTQHLFNHFKSIISTQQKINNKKSITTGTVQAEQASAHLEAAVPRRRINVRMVENVLLVWLDNNIDENSTDCCNTIAQLRSAVNTINTFTDGEDCIQFLNSMSNEKVCMIISASLGQHIVPRVHDMSQVDSIFIFCDNKKRHERWVREWPKIRGIFIEISLICEALKQAAGQCEQNAISISFMATSGDYSKKNLDQLDPSFMYTQILKEILLSIRFEQEHIIEFTEYCRDMFVGNKRELKNVDQVERRYREQTPIWWYTNECFLYPMLNRALRLMEADTIIKMGFFIGDLHRHIEQLHSEQFRNHQSSLSFMVYRGQGMSKTDFEQMTKTKSGLMSFNNFLSTSTNRDVSLSFARQVLSNWDMVGVLFVMKIDPAKSTTPFASTVGVSYFFAENEVLFSMHTVFRICDIKSMGENPRLFQVELTLTSDNDKDLRQLTDRIREETEGSTGWYRLGSLLLKMGQFEKAQEVYEILLEQTTDENEKGSIYSQLGWVKDYQGEYKEAITYYEISLEISERNLPPNHPDLAASYNNIGMVYDKMNEYSKALSSYEKALEIQQQSLPPNHPNLASSYNNIGNVYDNMGEYSKALSNHEKALEIRQQSLPPNHPDLATSYDNIGIVFRKMGEYPKALASYEKSLEISERSLPPNHPDLAASFNNIGVVYKYMDEYSKARSFYERAVDIGQQSLPSNHPNLQIYRKNLDVARKKLF